MCIIKWPLPLQSTDSQWRVHPTGVADDGSNLVHKASGREREREGLTNKFVVVYFVYYFVSVIFTLLSMKGLIYFFTDCIV